MTNRTTAEKYFDVFHVPNMPPVIDNGFKYRVYFVPALSWVQKSNSVNGLYEGSYVANDYKKAYIKFADGSRLDWDATNGFAVHKD